MRVIQRYLNEFVMKVLWSSDELLGNECISSHFVNIPDDKSKMFSERKFVE